MEKIFYVNGKEVKVQDFSLKGSELHFTLGEKSYSYSLIHRNGAELILDDGKRFKAVVGTLDREGEAVVMSLGREAFLSGAGKKIKKSGSHVGSLSSPMPGKIFKVLKKAGDEVTKGEAILILEAMKMEHSIRADKDGRVKKVNHQEGELVQGGVILAELE